MSFDHDLGIVTFSLQMPMLRERPPQVFELVDCGYRWVRGGLDKGKESGRVA